MLQFIKNWTLPLAMLAGIIGYFCFACFDFLAPLKPFVKAQIAWLTPFLIFTQLLLTFCKVEVKDLSPKRWRFPACSLPEPYWFSDSTIIGKRL